MDHTEQWRAVVRGISQRINYEHLLIQIYTIQWQILHCGYKQRAMSILLEGLLLSI